MSFKETDIRPSGLMPEAFALLEEDTRRLVSRKSEFVRVPCPACTGTKARDLWEKRGVTFQVCERCETVFVNPRPTPEILDQYYREALYYEYWNKYIYPQSEQTRRQRIFRPRAQKIAELCYRLKCGTRTLVEVGAGHGMFCEEMRDLGLFEKVIAIEPTPSLAETCRQRGLEVIEQRVEDVRLERGVIDIIVSFEVIEHLLSPRDFVLDCARLLHERGLLVLTCPNIKGFDLAVLEKVADTITPEHLNYFHPRSLTLLVRKCDLDVIEIGTPGQLDVEIVRNKVLAGKFDLAGMPFLRRVVLDDWDRIGGAFQAFLRLNQLSSHMWLVARKPG